MQNVGTALRALFFTSAYLLISFNSAWAWPYAKRCPADLDGDHRVTLSDLSAVLAARGTSDKRADLNCSGSVDDNDVLIVDAYFGGCFTLKGDVDGDGIVGRRDLALVRRMFGGPGPSADFNQNGTVDLGDLAIVLARQGKAYRQRGRCQLPDLDADGIVGLSDLSQILAKVGRIGLSRLDLNRDERIDLKDVEIVQAFFGLSRP